MKNMMRRIVPVVILALALSTVGVALAATIGPEEVNYAGTQATLKVVGTPIGKSCNNGEDGEFYDQLNGTWKGKVAGVGTPDVPITGILTLNLTFLEAVNGPHAAEGVGFGNATLKTLSSPHTTLFKGSVEAVTSAPDPGHISGRAFWDASQPGAGGELLWANMELQLIGTTLSVRFGPPPALGFPNYSAEFNNQTCF